MTTNKETSKFIIQNGVFIGAGVNKGRIYIDNSQNKNKDVAIELQDILENLYLRYSQASASALQKEIVLKMELQEIAAVDPSFIQRLRNALKAGGIELVKVLANNPFVSVSLETLKGWIESTTN